MSAATGAVSGPAGAPGTRRLSRGVIAGYAAGSVGTGGFGTVPGLLLLIYLTDELGVAATLAAVVVFLPKAWDVILNPLVGTWSDRTKSRWGPRVPWMLAGAIILPIFFVLMFSVPGLTGGGAAAYVIVMFLLAATGYAFFQVPYVAVPAEITDSYRERTTMTAIRIVVLTLAILVFGAGAPLIVDAGGDGLAGYRLMGLVAAVVLFLGFMGAVIGIRKAPIVVRAEPEGSLREQLVAIRENRDFRVLFLSFVIQALAVGAMLAATPYVATYLLGDEKATTLLFAALVGPAILVMPLWRLVAGRSGKERGFLYATLVFLVGALTLTFTRGLPTVAVIGAVALCGIGYAGMQMFPLAMLPDTIHVDTLQTGRRRAGTFTGVWTAGETAGLALGPALYAGVLAMGGYISSTSSNVADQPDSALLAIALGFGLVPGILIAVSIPLLRRYRLTEAALVELETRAAETQPDA
ncbi:MAG: MFS transporter [Candidatus Nanopelagicales bacterium]